MAKIKLFNTRRHDIQVNFVDPSGPRLPGQESKDDKGSPAGNKPQALGKAVIPAARPHPTEANKMVDGFTEVEDSLVQAARKRHPSVEAMFKERWLYTEAPAAPAKPAEQK